MTDRGGGGILSSLLRNASPSWHRHSWATIYLTNYAMSGYDLGMDDQVRLLMHKDVVYEDDDVLLTGHAFVNCTFRRCTLTLRDGASHMERCTFEACVWRLDMLVHDVSQMQHLRSLMAYIERSLPGAALFSDGAYGTVGKPGGETEGETGSTT